jgi:hypothetical protein
MGRMGIMVKVFDQKGERNWCKFGNLLITKNGHAKRMEGLKNIPIGEVSQSEKSIER